MKCTSTGVDPKLVSPGVEPTTSRLRGTEWVPRVNKVCERGPIIYSSHCGGIIYQIESVIGQKESKIPTSTFSSLSLHA